MGALLIGQREGVEPLSNHKIELVSGIANQAALAIEGAQLFAAQQEEQWVTTALLTVAELVNSTPDLATDPGNTGAPDPDAGRRFALRSVPVGCGDALLCRRRGVRPAPGSRGRVYCMLSLRRSRDVRWGAGRRDGRDSRGRGLSLPDPGGAGICSMYLRSSPCRWLTRER